VIDEHVCNFILIFTLDRDTTETSVHMSGGLEQRDHLAETVAGCDFQPSHVLGEQQYLPCT
jgi:hypothetical protein